MRYRALWLAAGWSICAAILWLSLTPSPPKLDFQYGDKVGHFAAYGTLMYWFCLLYLKQTARLGYAAGFVAMGIAIEFIQGALGYRTFEVADMVADAFGVALGWGAALILPIPLPGSRSGTQ